MSRVGIIAVHHEVAGGIDIAEHLPADVPLAEARLESDGRAVPHRDRSRCISRIVVVDVDSRGWQLAFEIFDHLADGQRLVIAGNDDCNLVLIHPEHFPI